MAHFIGTIDPSANRRTEFIRQAQEVLTSCFGSPAQVFEHSNLALVSWSQIWEPFHHAESADDAYFIWGHAIGDRQVLDLASFWRTAPETMPAPLEGMHTAFLYRSDGSWIAAADIFGMMPVYYYCGADYVLVGSTPELFRTHAEFLPELDPEGLAGILLTNGLVGGRSLLKGVRRLGAGNLLNASVASAPRELPQYRPEISDRYFRYSFEDNFERMEAALDECLCRHLTGDRRYGLLLSGGLDSRLMAGLLKQRGVDFAAISFGSVHDIEMKCAVAVAKSLNLEHKIVPVQMQNYREYAENECKWKHLANGLNCLMLNESIDESAQFQGGLLSGYSMDALLGGSQIFWAGKDPDTMCFDEYFRRINRWAIPVETVKRLLAKSFNTTMVDDVLMELEQTYNAFATREYQKSWLFGHYHRNRYHTSAVLGLNGRWPSPVVPYIDSKMIDLMGGMPIAHFEYRRMQYHMLKEKFPDLARISLDRNNFHIKPLVPRNGRLADHLILKPREIFYRWTRGIRDRRFYYRTMDFDSSGWNAVRAAAEPYRKNVLNILDEATLAEILPRPGKHVTVRDGIIDTSKMKLLAGFLLWSADYL